MSRLASIAVPAAIAAAITACASPERDAIVRLFDRSRNIALIDQTEQKAVVAHDLHPLFVALVGSETSPPPFNVSIASRADFLSRFLPAFNAAVKPRIKDARTTVESIVVRGNTAYVTTMTTATLKARGNTRREITQRTHHFLVKVEGRGNPRWVVLTEVPELAESTVKEGATR